jgi:catechol 2,3-dioxygenase-like lactoylglutathione lyase family enzyme
MPRPLTIDHMTLPVGDLDRSVAFYRAALVDGMGWVQVDVEGLPTFGPPGAEDTPSARMDR